MDCQPSCEKKEGSGDPGGRRATLWQHRDFLKVWAGQTISLCGSEVTTLAFPLVAVLTLRASAAQMGFLRAAQYVPFLLLGLVAGVWVDRSRRRPMMIAADIGRFLLLGFIPVAAFLHLLNMAEMYIVAFVVGTLTLLFDVAYTAYVPSLIDRDKVIDGNSKLELTASAAQLVGPGLGGMLVQLVSAPGALLVDAISFGISALTLRMVHTTEAATTRRAEKRNMLTEIGFGLRMLLRNPILRPILCSSINFTLFTSISSTLYILYVTYTLHMPPAVLGIIFTVGGLGAIPGALIGKWLTERFGIGITLIMALLLYGCSELLVPLAAGPQFMVIAMLITGQLLGGLTYVIWNIHQLSVRQILTPDHLLGRVNASYRCLVWGIIPVGALIGGILGTILGLQTTLFIGAFGTIAVPVWMLLSPVRRLREVSAAPEGSQ